MKIGILTFHWATNYGAVLQCYALQNYLISLGHEVIIINYKPKQYDDNISNFFNLRKFLNILEYFKEKMKEKALKEFRKEHLILTKRIFSFKNIPSNVPKLDVIISGSDQVANPSFLLSGEGKGKISPTYLLGFPFIGKRVGYALSFGCVKYPEKAIKIASKYIQAFNSISVREITGIKIAEALGRKDAKIVPDPTLLMSPNFYEALADEENLTNVKSRYIYSFFIRNIKERKVALDRIFNKNKILWNNEDGDYSVQGWLNKIRFADFVVTDSFHCMVMCLKLRKSFIVVTEKMGNTGMNDRFYTLLSILNMENRIINKQELSSALSINDLSAINWDEVDSRLYEYSQVGKKFLQSL